MACKHPIIPGSTPKTPPSAHEGTKPGGGGDGHGGSNSITFRCSTSTPNTPSTIPTQPIDNAQPIDNESSNSWSFCSSNFDPRSDSVGTQNLKPRYLWV